MTDLTSNVHGEIRLHSRGIGKVLAYALLGFTLYVLFMGFINNPMGSYWVSLALNLFVIIPAVLFADFFIQEVVVNDFGVTRIGLFGRETVLNWDQIVKIKLIRNSSGMRELIIVGRGKKIVLSNTIILINKPNFWEAVFIVIDRANADGRQIKAGLLGRRAWFYHGSTYLPGDKFEDRKADLNGPVTN